MKVLFLAGYIYEKEIKEFTRNKTGYGMMVKDIAMSVANTIEVFMLTNVITRKRKLKGINLIRHRAIDIIREQSMKSVFCSLRRFFSGNENLSMRLRYIYYSLDSYYTEKVIEQLRPDIIHIHGLSFRTQDYIKISNKHNIPHIVTLHALIGLDDSVGATKYDISYEKEFFNKIIKNKSIVTVISSGMKKRILSEYNSQIDKEITVINNGIKIEKMPIKENKVKQRYGIPNECKVMVCIGSICNRKNQIQIVHAYNLLPKRIKDKLYILFIGNDTLDGQLEKLIDKYHYSANLIPCGFIERTQLNAFLEVADYNIIASKDEAFGLSIIEAFSYGIPTVTFSDLDAIQDLYRDDVMVLVKDRETASLSNAIQEMLKRNWDRKTIEDYARKFSLEEMGLEYIDLYEYICNAKYKMKKESSV